MLSGIAIKLFVYPSATLLLYCSGLWRDLRGADSFFYIFNSFDMPKTNELRVSVNNSSAQSSSFADETAIVLTKESNEVTIRSYFEGILKLSQSIKDYPVNLDEVWMLAYSEKGKAVRALKKEFIESIDYQVFLKNGENSNSTLAQNGKRSNGGKFNGENKITYMLSTSCLEYFIARKVRPVFEVYRQVFHKAVKKEITYTESQVKALKTDATLWKNQAKMFEDKLLREKARSKALEETKNIEMDLKNSCFHFLIKKKLYDEWHSFNIAQKEEAIYQRLKKEEKERLKKLMPLPF